MLERMVLFCQARDYANKYEAVTHMLTKPYGWEISFVSIVYSNK